jgi:hypothetical protein
MLVFWGFRNEGKAAMSEIQAANLPVPGRVIGENPGKDENRRCKRLNILTNN